MKEIISTRTTGEYAMLVTCERCGTKILDITITREQKYDFQHEYIFITDLLVDIRKKSIDEARKIEKCCDLELCPKCLENLKERGFIECK